MYSYEKLSKILRGVHKAQRRVVYIGGYILCIKGEKIRIYICIYFSVHKETESCI